MRPNDEVRDHCHIPENEVQHFQNWKRYRFETLLLCCRWLTDKFCLDPMCTQRLKSLSFAWWNSKNSKCGAFSAICFFKDATYSLQLYSIQIGSCVTFMILQQTFRSIHFKVCSWGRTHNRQRFIFADLVSVIIFAFTHKHGLIVIVQAPGGGKTIPQTSKK